MLSVTTTTAAGITTTTAFAETTPPAEQRALIQAALDGNTLVGNGTAPTRIDGYLQTFGDADPLNDRYIATHGVTVDGVAVPDPAVPPGVTLYGYVVTAGDDVITGTAGRDAIDAGGGDDWISGGDGNDTLYGNAGRDTLLGGAGFDTVDFSGFAAGVRVDLTATSGANAWNAGTATALADLDRIEALAGTAFDDSLTGDGAANTLAGGAGADTLSGAGGNDWLRRGTGNDVLTGGSGSDRFAFDAGSGRDTIRDFARGKDKVVFEGPGGPASFAQLSISVSAKGAVVAFGGDQILLEGVKAQQLAASDFIFA